MFFFIMWTYNLNTLINKGKKYMNIIDDCSILKKIISLARENNYTEHGAIAIGTATQKNKEYTLVLEYK